MAFMMPVMKKNYNIYGGGERARNPSGGDGATVRKTSQGSANGASSTNSSNTNLGGGASSSRRKVRSEGPSLSTSPKHSISQNGQVVIIQRIPIPRNNSAIGTGGSGHPPLSPSKSVPMRRVRGSTPAFGGHVPSPFVRHNSLPEGPNAVIVVPVSPTHSTGSTSSSDSSSEDHPHHHRFHIKLLNRLKKSFRVKDPAPAAS